MDYKSAVPDTNNAWEYWKTRTPIWIDGITAFTNLTYQDLDNGATYVKKLNTRVKASGAPEPSLPAPPKPYATPRGFGDDITEFFAVSKEAGIAHDRMFLNVNPRLEGAVNGTVVAAQSGPSYEQELPDYEYSWVRDASLTMDVVRELYAAAEDGEVESAYETLLFEYAAARATEQNDPGVQTGLGEPKFYLDNTVFSGPWGRPQNDGPATAALTLIEFVDAYLKHGGDIGTAREKIYDSDAHPTTAPVKKDLLFVAEQWRSPSFDLWEEVEGNHFYTLMVQRRALVLGAKFATKMQDSETAATLSAEVDAISAQINKFWDPNREILLYEYGPVLSNKASYLDTAVLLGILHGYAGDGFYSYTNDRVFSTAVRIATAFINVYPIANKSRSDSDGRPLAPPVGRYPEDVFNGIKTKPNGGNPWYLCTAAFAEFMYLASAEFTTLKRLSVTATSEPFFSYFAPSVQLKVGQTYGSGSKEFKQVIESLNGWGDAFMRTIEFYTPNDGHLTEEINRSTGEPQGAADLTWSYAAVLTAAMARAKVREDGEFLRDLANRATNVHP